MNMSPRSQRSSRAGSQSGDDEDEPELAFQVVVFKKITNERVPFGLDVDTITKFFTGLFTFSNQERRDEFEKTTKNLIGNPKHHFLAITALVFDADVQDIVHTIIAASLYTHDQSNGSFIFNLGVLDRGDPKVCLLSKAFFIEPLRQADDTGNAILSDTATFRNKGLATFMLSLIQVLGYTGYNATSVPELEGPFTIPCDENAAEKKHHLYLQARVEYYSAYSLYVKVGFTLHAETLADLHCTDYKKDCPVHPHKPPNDGYYTDDRFQRLLTMKHWIYNVYPPEEKFRTGAENTSTLWNVHHLPRNQFLSSALPTPLITDVTLGFTNRAYYNLLNTKKNVGRLASPLTVHRVPRDMMSTPCPIDPYLPHDRHVLSQQMIMGKEIYQDDVRRTLFRNLNVYPCDYGMDSFDAITTVLYLQGKSNVFFHDFYHEDDRKELSMEIRINLSAFYQRHTHFRFINDLMLAWSKLAIDEFQFFDDSQRAKYGFGGFHIVPLTADNRGAWKENFTLLAHRLITTQTLGKVYPPLMTDLIALQLLYSRQSRPVYFAPVYGLIRAFTSEDKVTSYVGEAQVPSPADLLSVLDTISAADLVDTMTQEYTVVPIMPLHGTSFGILSAPPPDPMPETYEKMDEFYQGIFPIYQSHFEENMARYKLLTPLKDLPVDIDSVSDPCASKWLCRHRLPEISERICPGCIQPVHLNCGVSSNPDMSQPDGPYDFTCFLCYHHFGRPLDGEKDPGFGTMKEPSAPASSKGKKGKSKAAAKSKKTMSKAAATDESSRVRIPRRPPLQKPPPDPTVPSQNTRTRGPSQIEVDNDSNPSTETPRRQKTIDKYERIDRRIDKKNPKYMYSIAEKETETTEDDWWIESDDEPAVTQFHAITPVQSHVLSDVELNARSETTTIDFPLEPQSFKHIIQAAITLRTNFSFDRMGSQKTAPWVHRPDRPYTDQELVDLCCLVDRGRTLQVDATASTKKWVVTLVESYPLNSKVKLGDYLQTKKKDIPKVERSFRVFRQWLKQYLDKFDPDLYEYIDTFTYGMPVLTLPGRLAGHDQDSYDQQGVVKRDKYMVPLPKTHRVVTTKESFGLLDPSGHVVPYSTDPYGLPSKTPKFDETFVASCNPSGFELVPVALPPQKVPDHHLQIRAIRAQIKNRRGGDAVTRWLGLQGEKYVSLPKPWVELNFSKKLREEAIELATSGSRERFLVLPPGDSRPDDPPIRLRDSRGRNYYYQGEVDNCLIGGFANAVFWMFGEEKSDQLLQKELPVGFLCWNLFVNHVTVCLPKYFLRKLHNCQDVLDLDDQLPLVVQLGAGDKSENHVISIYDGCIFDSASRFVLQKSLEAFTWCCGLYGFKRHLRVYQLEKRAYLPNEEKKRKKQKRSRGHHEYKGKKG